MRTIFFANPDVKNRTIIFRYPIALQQGDVIKTAYSEDDEGDTIIFECEQETMFYFVDYHADSYFGHPVEFIFVKLDDLSCTRVTGEWWPLVNDQKVFCSNEQRKTDILKSYNPDYYATDEVYT